MLGFFGFVLCLVFLRQGLAQTGLRFAVIFFFSNTEIIGIPTQPGSPSFLNTGIETLGNRAVE